MNGVGGRHEGCTLRATRTVDVHVRCVREMKRVDWKCAYLPPSVVVLVVFLDDLDGLSDFKCYFVLVFRRKGVESVYIFGHVYGVRMQEG